MSPKSKDALKAALGCATVLVSDFVGVPIIIGAAHGVSDLGGLIAQRLIVGIFLFPVIFVSIWAWSMLKK